MEFGWNKTREARPFWDPVLQMEATTVESDKQILKNKEGRQFGEIFEALCRVTVELMDRIEAQQKLLEDVAAPQTANPHPLPPARSIGSDSGLCRSCLHPKRKTSIYCERCGQ